MFNFFLKALLALWSAARGVWNEYAHALNFSV
jgi:hypothetical protein